MAPDAEGKPPFFKTWAGAYALVLGWLGVCVVVFTIVTWVYA